MQKRKAPARRRHTSATPPVASVSAAVKPLAHKLLGLEVLRFIATIAVLLWHYQHFYYVGTQLTGFERSAQPFYTLLMPLYTFGHYGVQVFWAISGFIFFWKYQQAITTRRVDANRFFVLRFSRLYPLHIATLLVVAALQPLYMQMVGEPLVYQHNDFNRFPVAYGHGQRLVYPRQSWV